MPPFIVVSGKEASLRRAYTAIRAVMFASIAENQRFSYVNSFAFRTYAVDLSGEGYIPDSIERMYGRTIGVSANKVDIRPAQVPEDARIHANPAFASALIRACDDKDGRVSH